MRRRPHITGTTRVIRLGSNSASRHGDRSVPKALKRLSENVGAVGLVLGFILSMSSLYDVFVRKPEADRIEAISKFNQAVNSAAKIRQDLLQTMQTGDAASRLAAASMATPRILNEISTATALLPTLNDDDVGIPQLIILVTEAMTAGDNFSAQQLLNRAIQKENVTPYMKSEAHRHMGKYLFIIGKPDEGREYLVRSERLLGNEMQSIAARAFVRADLVSMEYASGKCGSLDADVGELARLLSAPSVPLDARTQIVGVLARQFDQFKSRGCPTPEKFASLIGDR